MKEADKQALHPDRWRRNENHVLGMRRHDNHDNATYSPWERHKAGNLNLVEHRDARRQAFLADSWRRG